MKKICFIAIALLASLNICAKYYVVKSTADWAEIKSDAGGNTIVVRMTLGDEDIAQLKDITTKYKTKLLDLSEAVFPNDEMPDDMFTKPDYESCTYLQSVIMPKSLKKAGKCIFRKQTRLTEVTFPNFSCFEEFGEDAFTECKSLEYVKLPASMKYVPTNFITNTSATPEGISIVFEKNSQLETIETRGFYNTNYVMTLKLAGTLRTVGDEAFLCDNTRPHMLYEIMFDKGDEPLTIGANAFKGHNNLKRVIMLRSMVPSIAVDAFEDDAYENVTLFVPAGMIDTYKADAVFGKFAKIEEYVAPAPKPKAAVYITAGQSNAEGRTDVKYMSENLRSYVFHHAKHQVLMKGAQSSFTRKSFSSGGFCFTDICNIYLDQDATETFYSVNGARGGTPIEAHSDYGNYKGPAWSADPEWIAQQEPFDQSLNPYPTGQSLSKGLFESFKTLAAKTLDRLEEGYEVKAILWHQGENDWHDGSKYYNNLKTMIQYFRDQLYEITGNESAKTVPFITGTVAKKNGMYSKQVEEATKKVCEDDPYTYLVDCGDFPIMSVESDGHEDKLHFSSPSVEAIGKLFYEKIVEIGAGTADVSGVENVYFNENDNDNENKNAVYNTLGQRINKAGKGIVIKNNKKYVAY